MTVREEARNETAYEHGAGDSRDAHRADRPLFRSLLRGLICRCPACGNGRLFGAFLKPVDACAVCGTELHHHRSDDLPPYIAIFVVGHVMVGGFMMTDMMFEISPWAHLAVWAPLTVLAALALIQPIKGAVIGLQWALKMHGFGDERDDRDPGRGGPTE
ncbi:DUF983 domain-containing protein [Neorhizobium sp. NPDC001467]|uniref:DUF983 domain-containing protein n=1 Tax=Neorhizobium sp. NPDC001467 TaxID=3390595 RepID=UPI003CFC1E22